CLNSINRFILKNDADQASLYLTKFAKLIRQTLNTSVGAEHSLKEELVMLDNYLSLEKLRFKEKVNYRIEVDPRLDTSVVRIPPLLIQPYVENALVHGLKETTLEGKIDVIVEPCPEGVKVSIVDNGVGYDPLAISTENKSLGMRITQQRLALLSAGKDTAQVKIKSLEKEDTSARGTNVEIVISTKTTAPR
ncbi:MAG: histidine kinase, partial [Bacteroidota bacterium]